MGRHRQCSDQHCNGTSAGVLALVRTRWFSKPLSICTDETGVLCHNPRLAGRVKRVMGREVLLFTACFEHSVGFRSDINANLMQDVCFLTRDGRLAFILGTDFNFPPSLWQDLSMHGGSLWIRKLGALVVIPEGTTHTCRTSKGQQPDIIDYFLVSTLIGPLIQKCEIVKSVLWGPHCGVKLVLNTNFESVVSRQLIGKISKQTATIRTHSKDRTRTTLRKPTQHFGTKQDAIVCSKARSLAVKTDRKTPKQHAPSMQTRAVSLKR